MRKALQILALSSLVMALLHCGKPEIKESQIADWTAVKETLAKEKETLDQKREELGKLLADIKNASQEEAGEALPNVDELKAKAKELGKEIEDMAVSFREKVAEELYDIEVAVAKIREKNAEVKLPEPHLEITRMMSDEDILVAGEFIKKHGDYFEALRILKSSLELDPENQKLKDALAKAEVDQWMTEERLAQVENGMTMDQVAELIGKVYHRFVQEFPEKNVLAWFYRREDGGTAGVYFQMKDGEHQVYQVDYNAKEPESETPAEE